MAIAPNKNNMVSLPSRRRLCASCDQWQGIRNLQPAKDNGLAISAERRGGVCGNGAWRGFSTIPSQACEQYERWTAVKGLPADPAVLSTTSQLHREIRMNSQLAAPLPESLRIRLDEVLLEIEMWHVRSPQDVLKDERSWFFREVVSGVLDCFYYIGWSTRKPVAEMTADDIWPL